MAVRTPREEKALAWYCEHYELKPQMSTYPTYRFLRRNGEELTNGISHIVKEWEEWKKGLKKKAQA